MAWTTLRTLAAQAAEAAPSNASGFVALSGADLFAVDANRLQYLEIAFGALTLGGAPTSVTFAIWRDSDGQIDRVGSTTIAAALAATPPPVVVAFHGQRAWVTVESFVGGTAPTVAGVVRARPVRV